MKDIRIEKVVLNICAGAEQSAVEKAHTLISTISGMKATKTRAKKRIATWKIRRGLPIGSKATLRGKRAEDLLIRLLASIGNELDTESFSKNGFSFGIKEDIYIQGVKYDPKGGIIGLEVCVSLSRPGYRVKNRKIRSVRVPLRHSITPEEATNFTVEKFGVVIV